MSANPPRSLVFEENQRIFDENRRRSSTLKENEKNGNRRRSSVVDENEKNFGANRRRSSIFDENQQIFHENRRRSSIFDESQQIFHENRRRSSIFEENTISEEDKNSSILEDFPQRFSKIEDPVLRDSEINGKIEPESIELQIYQNIEAESDPNDSFLILTKKQSQERINLLLKIWSVIFSIVILAYISHFTIILLTKKPLLVQPNIEIQEQGKLSKCKFCINIFFLHSWISNSSSWNSGEEWQIQFIGFSYDQK